MRKVSEAAAHTYCEDKQLPYIEASAKSATRVEEVNIDRQYKIKVDANKPDNYDMTTYCHTRCLSRALSTVFLYQFLARMLTQIQVFESLASSILDSRGKGGGEEERG